LKLWSLPSTDTVVFPSTVHQAYWHSLRTSCDESTYGDNIVYANILDKGSELSVWYPYYGADEKYLYHSNYYTFELNNASGIYGRKTL